MTVNGKGLDYVHNSATGAIQKKGQGKSRQTVQNYRTVQQQHTHTHWPTSIVHFYVFVQSKSRDTVLPYYSRNPALPRGFPIPEHKDDNKNENHKHEKKRRQRKKGDKHSNNTSRSQKATPPTATPVSPHDHNRLIMNERVEDQRVSRNNTNNSRDDDDDGQDVFAMDDTDASLTIPLPSRYKNDRSVWRDMALRPGWHFHCMGKLPMIRLFRSDQRELNIVFSCLVSFRLVSSHLSASTNDTHTTQHNILRSVLQQCPRRLPVDPALTRRSFTIIMLICGR